MKAIFVNLDHNTYDTHAVNTLAAVLEKVGVSVAYTSRPDRIDADFVLYSAFSSNVKQYIAFDRQLKNNHKHLTSIIGGPAITFDPSVIDRTTIDAGCVGDGEIALVDFLKYGTADKNIFLRGKKPEAYYPLADLDLLPMSDRRVVYDADELLRDNPSKQFLSGRGCPYACTYCFNHKWNELFKGCGNVIRKKSVRYLLNEITLIASRYPLKNIVFNDDTFILNREWFMDFAERFQREIGLTYTCNIRANLMDDSIAEALKESGCIGVNWSIESGNDYLRNTVLKRNMTEQQILRTAALLKRYRIPNRIGNVIGLPDETRDQMMQTLELNVRARPMLALANIFTPFPGLALTEYARRGGWLTGADMPKDFFTGTTLAFSEDDKDFIYKLFCLFPIFNLMPWLMRFKAVLFLMPRFVLRAAYEIVYTVGMARLYTKHTPLTIRARMAWRYIARMKGGKE